VFWHNVKAWLAGWRQWWRCCRKSKVWYVTRGYKECCTCGAIYWRD
jgi:hypothetical protein